MDDATVLARYDASLACVLSQRGLEPLVRDTPLTDGARLALAGAAFAAFLDAIPDLLGDMTLVKMFLAEAFESSGALLERARELVGVHLTFRVVTLEQLLRAPVGE
ncbi:hypothetical protein Q8F55_006631 [Vanrija albida]|uniref:Uncharacterized protein n=1 Tax=Vanrija albida TaxID=181172 RepID=A0ABR3PXN5_9TREE